MYRLTGAEDDDPDVDEAAVGDASVGRLPPLHAAPWAPLHIVRTLLLQQRRRRRLAAAAS